MIPRKFAPVLFSLILSGVMSLLVSGFSTVAALGTAAGLMTAWMKAWLGAWLFAFPVVLLVAPVAQRMVKSLTTED
jgi:hypothetical protein